jgi:hypothetical protein
MSSKNRQAIIVILFSTFASACAGNAVPVTPIRTQQAASSSTSDNGICGSLLQSEIESVFGEAMLAPVPVPGGECIYPSKRQFTANNQKVPAKALVLRVVSANAAEEFAKIPHDFPGSVPLEGIGDKAFVVTGVSGMLVVLQGRDMLIMLVSDTEHMNTAIIDAKVLAQMVLPRLPSILQTF